MSYLFVNHKGQYERFEEKKDFKKTFLLLFSIALIGFISGFALVFSNI
tara:strand:- start:121 stop:264 length:144 start_codon:yes stop_codon:yes gene_type:complete